MLAVLPFLIQWIALSQFGNQDIFYKQSSAYIQPTNSHWSLLQEFQHLPEDEIDHFLPQVCNMILDRDSLADDDLYDYFESVIEKKCADNFVFGTRVCGVLKAAQQPPSESLFKNILLSNTGKSEERLRAFQERTEYATSNGYNLPNGMSQQRNSYYQDYQFLLETLARLGTELKSFPVEKRNIHLRHALNQCNTLLYYRMASRGSLSTTKMSLQDIQYYPELTAENIATLCPIAAEYSLHYPMLRCTDRIQRIVRFIENECEVLPSKERCPYLVTVEVLEEEPHATTTRMQNNFLYAHKTNSHKLSKPNILNNRNKERMLPTATAKNNVMSMSTYEVRSSGVTPIGTSSSESPPSDVYIIPQSPSAVPYSHRRPYLSPRGRVASRRGSLLSDSMRRAKLSEIQGQYNSKTRGSGSAAAATMSVTEREDIAVQPLQLEEAEVGSAEEENEILEDQLQQAYAALDATASTTAPQYLPQRQQQQHNSENTPPRSETILQEGSLALQVFQSEHTSSKAKHCGQNCTQEKVANPDILGPSAIVGSQSTPPPTATTTDTITERMRGGSKPEQQLPIEQKPPSPTVVYVHKPSYQRRRHKTVAVAAVLAKQGSNAVAPMDTTQQQQQQQQEHLLGSAASSIPTEQKQDHCYPSPVRTTASNCSPSSAAILTEPPPTATVAVSTKPTHDISISNKWAEKKALLKAQSPFGKLPGWNIRSFIVKSGDDLRKEVLAMQLMEFCQKVFELEGLDIYLRPYQILSTGAQAGLIEYLENTESIDRMKKTLPRGLGLKHHFEVKFGQSYSVYYAKAVKNFVRSLAGYSLLTYIIQVKDRHNANILVDAEGHVIHIDFGFILGDSPGFNINFESAPFKLTREYLDVIGGLDSEAFKSFQDLFLRGFLALQKHIDGLTSIIQLFYGDQRKGVVDGVRSRLLFPQSQSDILGLVGDSVENWRTKQYDWYQERTNNIQC